MGGGAMSSERIPVSIVTGFLGSGKTTLIAALLRQPAMAGTAVVVNKFGEVGIDDARSSPTPSAPTTSASSPMAAFAARRAMIWSRRCGR